MIGLAATALLAAAPQSGQPAAVTQATATVRIVSGVRLKLAEPNRGQDTPPRRNAIIRTSDGPQPAKLIEFE